MHPDLRYWEKTQKWYPDAYKETMHDVDPRVDGKEIAMISDSFSQLCRDFLQSLREATGLDEKPVCESFDVMSVKEAAKYSVVGHHNISAKKWDVIPWAEKLYFGLDEDWI